MNWKLNVKNPFVNKRQQAYIQDSNQVRLKTIYCLSKYKFTKIQFFIKICYIIKLTFRHIFYLVLNISILTIAISFKILLNFVKLNSIV